MADEVVNAYSSPSTPPSRLSSTYLPIRRSLLQSRRYQVLSKPGRLLLVVVTAALAVVTPVGGNFMNFAIPEMVLYGSCANAQTAEQLSLQRFSGVWYQVEQVPNTYVDVKQCSKTNFIWDGRQYDATSIGWDDFNDLVQQVTSISQVEPIDPTQPRPYLQIRSSNVPPVPYHIINTDYVSFACVYSCFEFLGMKVEIYSTLARSPKHTNTSVVACHNSFEELGIDLTRLQPVWQGDNCWYNKPEEPLTSLDSGVETVEETIITVIPEEGEPNRQQPRLLKASTTKLPNTAGGHDVVDAAAGGDEDYEEMEEVLAFIATEVEAIFEDEGDPLPEGVDAEVNEDHTEVSTHTDEPPSGTSPALRRIPKKFSRGRKEGQGCGGRVCPGATTPGHAASLQPDIRLVESRPVSEGGQEYMRSRIPTTTTTTTTTATITAASKMREDHKLCTCGNTSPSPVTFSTILLFISLCLSHWAR